LQTPFAPMFNPFSFFMGGQFSPMSNQAFTQNNFYGQMFFNQYDLNLPKIEMPVREPSQAPVAIEEHIPPANVMIPAATRHTNIAQEALVF